MTRARAASTIAALAALAIAATGGSARAALTDAAGVPVPNTAAGAQLTSAPSCAGAATGACRRLALAATPGDDPATALARLWSPRGPRRIWRRRSTGWRERPPRRRRRSAQQEALAILEGRPLRSRVQRHPAAQLERPAKVRTVPAGGTVDVTQIRTPGHSATDTWMLAFEDPAQPYTIRYRITELGGAYGGELRPAPLLEQDGRRLGGLHSVLLPLATPALATGTTDASRFTGQRGLPQHGAPEQTRLATQTIAVRMPPPHLTRAILDPSARPHDPALLTLHPATPERIAGRRAGPRVHRHGAHGRAAGPRDRAPRADRARDADLGRPPRARHERPRGRQRRRHPRPRAGGRHAHPHPPPPGRGRRRRSARHRRAPEQRGLRLATAGPPSRRRARARARGEPGRLRPRDRAARPPRPRSRARRRRLGPLRLVPPSPRTPPLAAGDRPDRRARRPRRRLRPLARRSRRPATRRPRWSTSTAGRGPRASPSTPTTAPPRSTRRSTPTATSGSRSRAPTRWSRSGRTRTWTAPPAAGPSSRAAPTRAQSDRLPLGPNDIAVDERGHRVGDALARQRDRPHRSGADRAGTDHGRPRLPAHPVRRRRVRGAVPARSRRRASRASRCRWR